MAEDSNFTQHECSFLTVAEPEHFSFLAKLHATTLFFFTKAKIYESANSSKNQITVEGVV